jgi:hypothetical protein
MFGAFAWIKPDRMHAVNGKLVTRSIEDRVFFYTRLSWDEVFYVISGPN